MMNSTTPSPEAIRAATLHSKAPSGSLPSYSEIRCMSAEVLRLAAIDDTPKAFATMPPGILARAKARGLYAQDVDWFAMLLDELTRVTP